MKSERKLALTTRLSLAIVFTGLLPAVVIGLLAIRTASHMAEDVGVNCQLVAANIADKIDRNLFERYGDVQAFGANEAVNDQASWYQVGSAKNKIVVAANRYANLYGFYLLSYVVDLDGKVVAVNDQDPAGKPIDTAWLYQKNFKNTEWFQAAAAGRFTKSDILDGTYMQDLHVDEDVKKAYGGDGLVLGYSAPVKDAAGKVIGIWHNCANFSLVEEIVVNAYQHFKQTQCPDAEITVLDRQGRVIVDYDPVLLGKEAVPHDLNVLLKLNLAEKGLKSAQDLVAGKAGHGRYVHARKKVAQVNGYAVATGALGFPSYKWGVLVRVPESQALAVMHSQIWNIGIILALSVAGLIVVGVWLGRSISRPLIKGITTMHQIGEQVGAAAKEVSSASQSTAEGASEQAASLEETSASLEEIASMTKRNAENATNSATLGRQTRESAAAGLARIAEMGRTLDAIKSAVSELQAAVSEMQSSSQEISKIIKTIDEIAFQTNLLALNAAVEAARAGESGAGFAVVADEVRALAQRSAQAAKDTTEKIEASVKRSELGGVASAKVVTSLGEVQVTARNIEQVFNGIVTQIKSLDEVIAEIAAASKEQSQGVSEVNTTVSQMDKITQSNAASAEENASAAEELNAQVGCLQGIVTELQTIVAGSSSSASLSESGPNLESSAAPRASSAGAKWKVAGLASAKGGTSRSPSGSGAGSSHTPPKPGSVPSDLDIPMPELAGGGSAKDGFKDF